MIKIVVNNRKEPKPFPKLMKHGTYNYYVYFSEKSVGHIFGADKKFYHDDGFYSIEWGMRDFEDTNDEIILNYQGDVFITRNIVLIPVPILGSLLWTQMDILIILRYWNCVNEN